MSGELRVFHDSQSYEWVVAHSVDEAREWLIREGFFVPDEYFPEWKGHALSDDDLREQEVRMDDGRLVSMADVLAEELAKGATAPFMIANEY